MPFLGVFYRRESNTQTSRDALVQVASKEIWGQTPQNGLGPTVQAYAGPIPAVSRGIEFETEIEPHPNGSPFEARWYLGLTAGVQSRNNGQFACVVALRVDNHQP
jgi:hypothetical protein